MRSVMNTSKLLALGALLTLSTLAKGQSTMIAALTQPDSLVHQELGESGAEDYAAHPYGKGHLLFFSTRSGNCDDRKRSHRRMRLLHVRTFCV